MVDIDFLCREKALNEFKQLFPDDTELGLHDERVEALANAIEAMPSGQNWSHDDMNISMVSSLAAVFDSESIMRMSEAGLFDAPDESPGIRKHNPYQRLQQAMLLPYVLDLDAFHTTSDDGEGYLIECLPQVDADNMMSSPLLCMHLSNEDIRLLSALGSIGLRRLHMSNGYMMRLADQSIGLGVPENEIMDFMKNIRRSVMQCKSADIISTGQHSNAYCNTTRIIRWFYRFSVQADCWSMTKESLHLRGLIRYGCDSMLDKDWNTDTYSEWNSIRRVRMQDDDYAKLTPITTVFMYYQISSLTNNQEK